MENTESTLTESEIKAYSKCLFLGGYSIVFNNSIGLSLQLEDYFTTHYEFIPKVSLFDIKIQTKQFHFQEPVKIHLSEKEYTTYNPFVEVPAKLSMNYLRNKFPEKFKNIFISKSLVIETLQTKGFINKKHLARIGYWQKRGEFPNYKDHMGICEKTGIGSSACAIVSIVKTIFKIFDCEKNFDEIYYISLMSNSIAQKKIGSGFDIATSVYGSNVFCRVNKEVIEGLIEQYGKFMELKQNVNYIEFGKFEKMIQNKEEIKLSFVKELDEKFEIVMVNWSQGFDTRIAVRRVLDYFKDNEEKKKNFLEDSKNYVSSVKEALMEDEDNFDFVNLRKLNYDYRRVMKQVGRESGVEIEPDLASFILDFFLKKNEKILFGICPGAGGYDDIALLVRKGQKEEVIEELRNLNFLENWKKEEKHGLEIILMFGVDVDSLEEGIQKVSFDFR